MMHFLTLGVGIAIYDLLHYIHRNLFYTVVSTMTALLCIHSVAYLGRLGGFWGGGVGYLVLCASSFTSQSYRWQQVCILASEQIYDLLRPLLSPRLITSDWSHHFTHLLFILPILSWWRKGRKKVERGHYLFAGPCLLVTVRKVLYLPADLSNPEHALTSDPGDQIGLCNGMEWLWNCYPMGICRDGKERRVLMAVWRGN